MNRFTPVLRMMCETAAAVGSMQLMVEVSPAQASRFHRLMEAAYNDPYAIDATPWFDMVHTMAGLMAAMTNEELDEFLHALTIADLKALITP